MNECGRTMFILETTRASRRYEVSRAAVRFSGALSVALALWGCFTVGPDYVEPETRLPAAWSRELGGGLSAASPAEDGLARWWTVLGDPDLSALIERAAAGNRNLKVALARVREARARRAIAEAGYFPQVNFTASAARSRGSEQTGAGETRELYKTGFDATWEIDVFGRVRRSVEAAQGDLEASVADYHDVLVTVLAEVAVNYVEARTLQAQLQVAEENVEAQTETLQLTEWRFEAGLVSRLDVEQARSNLENTRAQLPRLRSDIEAARNRIAVLVGVHPGALDAELSARKPIPQPPVEIAVGVPAETLRRRPDVRRAERQLAAQTARVGVATADLYPRLSLPGSIGLEALSGDRLFSAGSRAASLAGSLVWTIFKGGAIRRAIEAQSALQQQALEQYEAAVLTALEDVENALVAYAGEQERQRALAEADQAARHAAQLARDQYASGLVDFQTVLDAERTSLASQDQLVQSRGRVASNLIALYKSLGGGWTQLAGLQP
ncbi:MAG TPA: efflux transporter outer membrane subunit [candidate division Zixibacteria bacterium]|nr:efflux transporter outer membrane subunit [candidate division Zixibacteria bacterium]